MDCDIVTFHGPMPSLIVYLSLKLFTTRKATATEEFPSLFNQGLYSKCFAFPSSRPGNWYSLFHHPFRSVISSFVPSVFIGLIKELIFPISLHWRDIYFLLHFSRFWKAFQYFSPLKYYSKEGNYRPRFSRFSLLFSSSSNFLFFSFFFLVVQNRKMKHSSLFITSNIIFFQFTLLSPNVLRST